MGCFSRSFRDGEKMRIRSGSTRKPCISDYRRELWVWQAGNDWRRKLRPTSGANYSNRRFRTPCGTRLLIGYKPSHVSKWTKKQARTFA